jgi:hypothetical protein
VLVARLNEALLSDAKEVRSRARVHSARFARARRSRIAKPLQRP